MSRTTRSRRKCMDYVSEVQMMNQTYIHWRTGLPTSLFEEGDWDRYARDGRHSNPARRNYREATNEIIRQKNRVVLHRLMRDPDAYDDMDFATKRDGKTRIWDFW